jgi:HD superfamily phosphodiesterase
METYLGTDQRRIAHALKVTGHAESILAQEPGDRETVLVASLLHDIGIPEAERKYGSAAGHLQELEGPPVARAILYRLGYTAPFIEEVCAIIGSHHSLGEVDSANFHVVWDADWLVNLEEEPSLQSESSRRQIIDNQMLTATGKTMAKERYLGNVLTAE